MAKQPQQPKQQQFVLEIFPCQTISHQKYFSFRIVWMHGVIEFSVRKEERWTQGMEFIFCFHNHVDTTRFVSLRMWKSINQIAIRITYICFDAVALVLLVIVKHRTLQRNVIWIDRINSTNKRMRKVCKCKYQKRMERTSG